MNPIELETRYCAHNYAPLPATVVQALHLLNMMPHAAWSAR
jgi:hypothetical protein